MNKTAQERSAFNKAKQIVNVKRHLTRMLDSKYKKLSDNTEKLDNLIRGTLSGTDKKDSFVRKVRLAQSALTRDNYLGCGVEMTDAVKMLTDAKVYLDKANIELAGTFEQLTKSRFEEEGGSSEDLERALKNIRTSSLNTKAFIIKEAGLLDWISGLKTNIGDAAYNVSNFSLWKRLFSKSAPVIKATQTMVSELQSVAKITIDLLGEMSQELASSDLENYYALSSKLSMAIDKFLSNFKTYMQLHFEPLLKKLSEKQEIESSRAIEAIKSKKQGPEFFKDLENIKFSELRQLDYEDIIWLGKQIGTKSDVPELKNVAMAVEKIRSDKNSSFKETFIEINNKPGLIDIMPVDFFIFLGYQSLAGLKAVDPEILEKLVNRLDAVKSKANRSSLEKLEQVKKELMDILLQNSEAKSVAASISFSHIKNSELSDKLARYLEKGKVAQALKAIDYEMAMVKEDKKTYYILNCFRDRIQDLDK